MASDLNTFALVGNLTRDAELRHTAGGTAIASMRLAVSTRVKRGEEWKDRSNYFNVTLFGPRAEPLSRYLTKGARIGVVGTLSWREWDQDGTRREAVELVADQLQLLDPKPAGAGAAAQEGASPPAPGGPPVTDDDLPF